MFAPFRCDVDGINNERQIVLRKRNYVVALKGLITFRAVRLWRANVDLTTFNKQDGGEIALDS